MRHTVSDPWLSRESTVYSCGQFRPAGRRHGRAGPRGRRLRRTLGPAFGLPGRRRVRPRRGGGGGPGPAGPGQKPAVGGGEAGGLGVWDRAGPGGGGVVAPVGDRAFRRALAGTV